MYELWHIGAAYVVGTAAGIGVFRHMIREDLVSRAIDTLVENDYVRTYTDEHGITHLHKWYDLDDLLEDAQVKIKINEEEEESEKDDTP